MNNQATNINSPTFNENTKLKADLKALDKLVTSLLEHHSQNPQGDTSIFDRFKSHSLRNRRSNHLEGGSGTSMPTILETNNSNNSGPIRRVVNSIVNAPHQFLQTTDDQSEERINLTQNILD